MTSRLRIFASVFTLLVAASSLAGCSFEPGEHTQLVGQECFNDDQCVSGAVCVQRRCQYEGQAQVDDADMPDGGPDDADVEYFDGPYYPDVPGTMDVGGTEDGGQAEVCRPTTTRCIDSTQVEYCRDDGTGFETRNCEDGFRCAQGQCEPVDQSVCRFQDQPCNNEGFSNGYYCVDISEDGSQMRCLGICDINANDPNSTCPQAGTNCTFGDDDGAICLSSCDLDEGCSTPGFGCLPTDGSLDEGTCVPFNPANEVGDRCDDDNFFDCEEGAICLDIQNGGRCVEGCRTFTGGAGTDCANGHCVPLTPTLGMCRPDAGNLSEGDECRQRQIYQACGDDGVICAPTGGWQAPQCTRFCRLDEGDADCSADQDCIQFDNQRDDLGVCAN
jgi:hypothetical protein